MAASRKYHYKEMEWTQDDELRYLAKEAHDRNEDHHSGNAGKTLVYLKGKGDKKK